MPTRVAALVVAAAATLAVAPPVSATPSVPGRSAQLPVEIPPPSQRVYMVTESVGLGAKGAVERAFPADWQVTVDGTPALFVEQLESKHVRPRLASSPWVFGESAVVAGGHNYPYWDPARFDRSIDQMIATLHDAGVTRIYWVTVREVKQQFVSPSAWRQAQPFVWYLPEVNEHLRAAVARHPDLSLIDWAAIADRPGITYDAIHLNTLGASLYSELIRSTVMGDLHRPVAGSVTTVPVGSVPGATGGAVALNLTVTSTRAAGFLTAFPCSGGRPVVSNANYVAGDTLAAAAIVPVGADGTVCVFTSDATHLVVDASGGFPAGAGFVPVAPSRLADTRDAPGVRLAAGTVLRVPVRGVAGVPTDAAAVAVTVTATGSSLPGFARVVPCGGAVSTTSNVNFDAGATVPNLVVAAPGADGAICVTSNVDVHLLVDVFGAFAATAPVGVLQPSRLVDTRVAGGAPTRLAAGGVLTVKVAGAGVPAAVNGAMINLTAVTPAADGYLTAYPCAAGAPTASNLNVRAGVDRANFALVAPDAAGTICIFSSVDTDVVIDLLGWIGAAFTGTSPVRVLDTRA
jgi:hypothetical protein